ncbi:VOC family protein [Promicromonospora alba]|uniref:VOC family protein n=1 Tax=Promicromonospora alba TaxID=1616110 RepID=A0ABV9HQJ0_9MICO
MNPRIRQVVLDTTDARALAEFYRQLFGLSYRRSPIRTATRSASSWVDRTYRYPAGGANDSSTTSAR